MKNIILVFLCVGPLLVFSQPKNKDYSPPVLMRGIGISFQEFDGLNSRIAGRPEYKSLRDYAGVLNLGFMKIQNRLITDVDLTAGSSMSGDRNRKSSAIRYAGAGIDIGYDVIGGEKMMLYPIVGIGGQAYMARFYKDVSQVPFDIVLASSDAQNSIRPVSFTNSFVTYRLGLGIAIKSPKNPSGIFGVQVGYTGSFKDKSWKSSDNQELANAPSDAVSQFHVSLVMMTIPRMMMKGK